MRTAWQRGTERTIAWPRSSIADADKDRVSFLPGDAAVTSGNRLPVLPMLLVLLALNVRVIPPVFGLASKDVARLNRAVSGRGTEDGKAAIDSELSARAAVVTSLMAEAEVLRPRIVRVRPPTADPARVGLAEPPRDHPLFGRVVVADFTLGAGMLLLINIYSGVYIC